MSEVAWFSLLLRAIGVLVLVVAGPGFIGYLGYLPLGIASGVGWEWYLPAIAWLCGYVIAGGVAVYLIRGGKRIVRYCVDDLVGRCAVCGYPLTRVNGDVCPECGVPFHHPTHQHTRASEEPE